MEIQEINKAPFINREEELIFLKNRIAEQPKNILFLTGPKSSGKTTLLNQLIKLHMSDGKYDIKHFNLRKILIANYKDFLQTFFEVDYSKSKENVKEKREYDLKVFKLTVETLKGLENKEHDPFVVMEKELQKKADQGIRPVIIIDELQALDGIYMNGQKELLAEIFNFFVAMTKESHLCHVIIASSDGFFIERIYNDSKLKKTSKFMNVDYLHQKDIKYWMDNLASLSSIENLTLSEQQKEKIWETFEGSCWEISAFLEDILTCTKDGIVQDKEFDSKIECVLTLAKSYFYEYAKWSEKIQFLFKSIHRAQQKRNYFVSEDVIDCLKEGDYTREELSDALRDLVQQNFIAYDPACAQYTLQGRSMEIGFKMYVQGLN